jgi:DNA-binding transcriptional ArsR family regulator
MWRSIEVIGMQKLMTITKALADSNRVRVLMFLTKGEFCVCQLIELLGLAPSTVSKHMSVLYHAGLVETRKEGRWMYYRLPDKPSSAIRGSLQWLQQSLIHDEQILADEKKIKALRKMPKEDFCCHYK